MDEPWWEGRVASDVHCTLREKVSPSQPLSLARTGYLESLSLSCTCLVWDTPRGNSELLVPICAPALLPSWGSGIFLLGEDLKIQELGVGFSGKQSSRQLNGE